MNFLQLVSRLKQECGLLPGYNLSTVQGASGELLRLRDWTNAAWLQIQETHADWLWMKAPVSFATEGGKATYSPDDCGLSDFGQWDRDSFRCYPTAVGVAGEQFLSPRQYDGWRNLYQFGSYRLTQNRPCEITVTPSMALGLGPTPNDAGWTVDGEYYRCPTPMVADTDIPALPVKFHLAIVYLAMTFYRDREGKESPGITQRGRSEYSRMMSQMNANQLPGMFAAGPLA